MSTKITENPKEKIRGQVCNGAGGGGGNGGPSGKFTIAKHLAFLSLISRKRKRKKRGRKSRANGANHRDRTREKRLQGGDLMTHLGRIVPVSCRYTSAHRNPLSRILGRRGRGGSAVPQGVLKGDETKNQRKRGAYEIKYIEWLKKAQRRECGKKIGSKEKGKGTTNWLGSLPAGGVGCKKSGSNAQRRERKSKQMIILVTALREWKEGRAKIKGKKDQSSSGAAQRRKYPKKQREEGTSRHTAVRTLFC